jgi:PAS domain S-box-containing protein
MDSFERRPTTPPARILLVEDLATDAELISRELGQALGSCATHRVQCEAELVRGLHDFTPDVVLTDHSLPQFNAMDALRVVQRERPLTPVIVVTGSLDEETAADYIKAGATDYVVKQRLHRIGPAVHRALALRQALQDAAEVEAALRRSEHRFRRLVEHGSDVVTLLDANGRILFSSHALKPTLGYAPGEKIGRSVFDLLHPEDRARAEPLFRTVLQHPDRVAKADLRVQHKDGSWRELEVVAVNHLEDAAVEAIVVNYHDVTERKHTENQLRRMTEFLSHAQAVAHVGSWEWDMATDVITWSEETYRIFGVDPAAGPLSFERYVELIHPDDRDALDDAVGRARETREPFEIDHRIVRPDGEVRFLYGRGGIARDAVGNPRRLIGAVLDITGRKLAEEALRRANERLQTVIQSSPLAIFSVNADGIVQSWNPAAERLFGWTAEEIIGALVPIVSDANEEQYREARRRVMQGEALTGIALARRKKDGSSVTVNRFAAPLREPDGRVSGILVLIEDVTAMKRLEQQFYRAQKMEAVGRLAGGVAHDFNNLLTAILGSTDLLLETLPSDHPGRVDAEETLKATLRAADLTRQLSAFSRQQVLAPRVVSLNAIVAEMDRMLRRLIGEEVDLRTVLAEDLGAVRADSGQLEQVIVNLAVNARDAMPTGGRLTIETANVSLDDAYAAAHQAIVPGAYVMLALTDTGTGMDAETKSRMFEPFFTTKPKGKGTGLGLATVYGIVKQSGGTIWVYSEPGWGTTFKVYLPRVEAPVEPASPSPTVKDSARGSETILLVEDQEEVRRLTQKMLEARGYRVLVAAGGPEALRLGKELDTLRLVERHGGRIDLLVTDVVMPGMSGGEVLRRLAPTYPEMKVLYLSGYPDESILHHGVLEPGVPFLQKPFTVEGLARKVREVLDTPGSQA